MRDDERWLAPWLGALRRHAAGRPVLELGCGDGRDTAVLAGAGLDVQAIDRYAQPKAAWLLAAVPIR